MYPDFKELLSVLNAHNVKYLIVRGACRITARTAPRHEDLDIWVKPKSENAKAVYAALMKFGARLRGWSLPTSPSWVRSSTLGHEPLAVDILSEIPGLDFDAAWERRVEGVIAR
jgi:hypothetical protein